MPRIGSTTSLAQIAPMPRRLPALLPHGHPGDTVAATDAISRVIDFIGRASDSRAARHLATRLQLLQNAMRRDPLDTEAHAPWSNKLTIDAELLAHGGGHNDGDCG